MYTVIAIVPMMLVSLVSGALWAWLPLYLRESGGSTRSFGLVYSAVGGLTAIVEAGCWVVLLVALFGWRGAAPPQGAARAAVPPPPGPEPPRGQPTR
jgi:hypothetical protein